MENQRIGRTLALIFLLIYFVLWNVTCLYAAETDVTVITLTQTNCQFLEPEGVDHKFISNKSVDCEAINGENGEKRLAKAKPLVLKAGKHIFRVGNKNVAYPLGFWLRGKGFSRATLPSVSGGGLTLGKTKDYAITLKPGEYLYSCPLNPTPDYPLVVE